MNRFSDDFLGALGAWQKGWKEDKSKRVEVTSNLIAAIGRNSLPTEAMKAPPYCYRKRFLVPNNPQNGGDLWPLFWDGEIVEGVASWTTDCEYAKNLFKKDLRPNSFAAVFRRVPSQNEVILNIPELWKITEFSERVDQYIVERGSDHEALRHFKDVQSEIIMNAPLTLDDIFSLCEKVPDLDTICDGLRKQNINVDGGYDEVWSRMVDANLFPTSNFWLEQAASQRVLDKVSDLFKRRIDNLIAKNKSK